MQTFAPSVHPVSNSATQSYVFACTAEHREAVLGVHDHKQQRRQREHTQPENNIAEGILAHLWTSQECEKSVWEEKQEKEKNQ